MKHDSLIFGKNQTENIVSIEVHEENAEIFIEENGIVRSEFVSNKFWLLSNKNCTGEFARLSGNQHFKYGLQFSDRQEFVKARSYLKHKADLYSIWGKEEALMVKDGYTYFKGMTIDQVSILSFDIETTGIVHNEKSKVLIISNTFRDGLGNLERKMFCYDDYKTDLDMFKAWEAWVNKKNPSILCGHNLCGYDLKYLEYCISNLGGSLNIGRDGSSLEFSDFESQFRKDGSQSYSYNKPKVYGREIIDTMFLAVKYDVGRKYESYGLKPIIDHEKLQVADRQFYDAATIKDNYKNPIEWKKIKQYAEHDADDSLALYDLMAPSFFYMTKSIPKPFQLVNESATGSQINSMLVRSYLQNKKSIPKASEVEHFTGGISMGNPGIYKNVYKIDVASLYPSIMLEFEVKLGDKDPDDNFGTMAEYFTKQRLHNKAMYGKTKEKTFDDLQASQKIFINSLFGFCGTRGLNFNNVESAALITRKGREILTGAIEWSKANGYQIVNADTDSVSISNNGFLSIDKRKEILSEINKLSGKLIAWEDDGYYPSFIVLKAKNYILCDEDGKIKTKGSALKDSKKEMALKDFMNEIILTIIDNKFDYEKIYAKYVKDALDMKDIKRWCSKKTITSKVLKPERTNEQKVLDALEGKNFQEGDKIWVFFKQDESLCLYEDFDGDYHKEKLLEKIFKTARVFGEILPVNELFPNLKLKKNRDLLENYL